MKSSRNRKKHIVVLFGGRSAEHEVSVESARNIAGALDMTKYNLTLIGITKNGVWLPFSFSQLASLKKVSLGVRKSVNKHIIPYTNRGEFLIKSTSSIRTEKIDVVFPVLHGPMGEDGTIQGLLKLANVPFVGAGVLGSAVGMDKDVMKRLFRDAGLSIPKFFVFLEYEKKEIKFEKIKEKFKLPFFIKPAKLGSSIGVSKTYSKKEFILAIELAFSYDNKILIEEYIPGKEIECSVLGNEELNVSVCGEIVPNHEFYSYEAKYLDRNGAILSIPADINNRLEEKIQKMALKAFKALCCEGMARVDFFVAKNDKVFINEINTIPGFTAISMYPKLWEMSGISYTKLLDTLIELAINRFQKEQKFLTSK